MMLLLLLYGQVWAAVWVPACDDDDDDVVVVVVVRPGVGSCLGTGMYLTSGIVASTMAGPAGVISLLLAGAASMLTGNVSCWWWWWG